MQHGNFPPTPAKDACGYCAYRDACRYEENRIIAKLERVEDC